MNQVWTCQDGLLTNCDSLIAISQNLIPKRATIVFEILEWNRYTTELEVVEIIARVYSFVYDVVIAVV